MFILSSVFIAASMTAGTFYGKDVKTKGVQSEPDNFVNKKLLLYVVTFIYITLKQLYSNEQENNL